MKEQSKKEGLRSVTLFSDRLHASGYHFPQGSFEVLLRRSSQWADIADYPEPFTNVWNKERNIQQKKDLGMFDKKKYNRRGRPSRKLYEVPGIKDPYHRFYYLVNTNQDRELQNLRMEDEEAVVIDRINFFVHFDFFDEPPTNPFLYLSWICFIVE